MLIKKKKIKPIVFLLTLLLIIISFIILNFSKGTKGSILNEFIIFYKQPYLVNDAEPKIKELLNSIIKSTFKVNYLKNNYSKIKINLPFKELAKLREDRKKALDLHPTEEFLYQKTWVKGEIEFNQKIYKAKIRLKGDRADHWGRNNRWSFQIKLADDQHIFGFNRFSITNHKARAFPQNEVISNSLQRLGVITLDLKTIQLSFNGDDWGLMYLEEHFGNNFFEKRKIKETPIVRFTNQSGAELIARSKNDNNTSENLSKLYFLTEKKTIKVYNSKKYLREKNTKNIISLFQSVKENGTLLSPNEEIFQLFNKKKFTTLVAMNMLLNDWHSSEPENIRYYFNVFNHKIEPIPTDFNGSSSYNNFSKINDHENVKKKLEKLPLFYQYIFKEEAFLKNFREALKEINQDIPNMKKNINLLCKNFINNCYDGLNFENINYNYNYIFNNIETIFDFEIISRMNNDEKETSIKLFKNMQNNSSLPIFKLTAEQLFIRYFSDNKIEISNLLPINFNIINISILYNEKLKKDNLLCDDKIDLSLNIKKFSNISINFSDYIKNDNCLKMIEGIFFKTQINNETIGNIYAYKEEYFYNLSSFFNKGKTTNLDIFELKDKTYFIDSGEYYLEYPLIIPSGYNLKIQGNTTIFFGEDAYIFLDHGKLILKSLDDQIILTSIKSSWRGIYTRNADVKIENTIIENINFFKFKETNIELTGGLNFFNSNININNLLIDKSYAEDAVNFIKSDFKIKNITIIDAKSDAIDSDYSNGSIEKLSIRNIEGDGLDTSGSNINLKDLTSFNVGDKSISIGESSIFEGENLDIILSNIGIAVKDSSVANIKNFKISKSKFADIMAYNKKPFYNKGGIINLEYKGGKSLVIKRDSLSQIKLNNSYFLENNFNF